MQSCSRAVLYTRGMLEGCRLDQVERARIYLFDLRFDLRIDESRCFSRSFIHSSQQRQTTIQSSRVFVPVCFPASSIKGPPNLDHKHSQVGLQPHPSPYPISVIDPSTNAMVGSDSLSLWPILTRACAVWQGQKRKVGWQGWCRGRRIERCFSVLKSGPPVPCRSYPPHAQARQLCTARWRRCPW